ncbi:MAG: prephenate dehydrogenase dimerization domain-containing protein, partial [Longimicrobiales bacterium]
PEVMAANAHDQQLAWSSHLPQLAASTLALALAQAGMPLSELGRGGLDVTRLAGSDPELWTGVVLENAQHIVPALAAVEKLMAELRTRIECGNEAEIRAALGRALRWSYTATAVE